MTITWSSTDAFIIFMLVTDFVPNAEHSGLVQYGVFVVVKNWRTNGRAIIRSLTILLKSLKHKHGRQTMLTWNGFHLILLNSQVLKILSPILGSVHLPTNRMQVPTYMVYLPR